jgi:hypothetical protein
LKCGAELRQRRKRKFCCEKCRDSFYHSPSCNTRRPNPIPPDSVRRRNQLAQGLCGNRNCTNPRDDKYTQCKECRAYYNGLARAAYRKNPERYWKKKGYGACKPPLQTTHGRSNTTEYRIWQGAKNRCFNTRDRKYPAYGGRGITMGQRWRESFADFFADVGLRPSVRHTLDRKNNDGNYEPGNVRWATAKVQANNRRSSVRSVEEELGIVV